MIIIEKPDPIIKKKWGPLAHVSEEERQRILNVPYGQFKGEVKRIENALAEMKKRNRAQSEFKSLHRHPEKPTT